MNLTAIKVLVTNAFLSRAPEFEFEKNPGSGIIEERALAFAKERKYAKAAKEWALLSKKFPNETLFKYNELAMYFLDNDFASAIPLLRYFSKNSNSKILAIYGYVIGSKDNTYLPSQDDWERVHDHLAPNKCMPLMVRARVLWKMERHQEALQELDSFWRDRSLSIWRYVNFKSDAIDDLDPPKTTGSRFLRFYRTITLGKGLVHINQAMGRALLFEAAPMRDALETALNKGNFRTRHEIAARFSNLRIKISPKNIAPGDPVFESAISDYIAKVQSRLSFEARINRVLDEIYAR